MRMSKEAPRSWQQLRSKHLGVLINKNILVQLVGVEFYVCNTVAQKMYNIKYISRFNVKYICLIMHVACDVMLFFIRDFTTEFQTSKSHLNISVSFVRKVSVFV